MTTSIHEGLVEFDSEFSAGEDQFCDAVYLRDGLQNGLLHLADEWAQVRINYVAPDPALLTGLSTSGYVGLGGDAEDEWSPMLAWTFPVTALDGPQPHRFRLHVAGVHSSDVSGAIRIVLVPAGTEITPELALESTDSVWHADVPPNTTMPDPEYLSGATLGSGYLEGIRLERTADGPLAATCIVFVQGSGEGSPLLVALRLSEVPPEDES